MIEMWMWIVVGFVGLWLIGALFSSSNRSPILVHPCYQTDEWAVDWTEPPNQPSGMDFDTKEEALSYASHLRVRLDTNVIVEDEHLLESFDKLEQRIR